jgi:hypothetical protein
MNRQECDAHVEKAVATVLIHQEVEDGVDVRLSRDDWEEMCRHINRATRVDLSWDDAAEITTVKDLKDAVWEIREIVNDAEGS